jgi:hypothetical protein
MKWLTYKLKNINCRSVCFSHIILMLQAVIKKLDSEPILAVLKPEGTDS